MSAFADQPFFGCRVADLGAGPEPISQKKLNADRLANASDQALSDAINEKARSTGEKMRHEDGAGAILKMVAAL